VAAAATRPPCDARRRHKRSGSRGVRGSGGRGGRGSFFGRKNDEDQPRHRLRATAAAAATGADLVRRPYSASRLFR
jgi:hypothetical protein